MLRETCPECAGSPIAGSQVHDFPGVTKSCSIKVVHTVIRFDANDYYWEFVAVPAGYPSRRLLD